MNTKIILTLFLVVPVLSSCNISPKIKKPHNEVSNEEFENSLLKNELYMSVAKPSENIFSFEVKINNKSKIIDKRIKNNTQKSSYGRNTVVKFNQNSHICCKKTKYLSSHASSERKGHSKSSELTIIESLNNQTLLGFSSDQKDLVYKNEVDEFTANNLIDGYSMFLLSKVLYDFFGAVPYFYPLGDKFYIDKNIYTCCTSRSSYENDFNVESQEILQIKINEDSIVLTGKHTDFTEKSKKTISKTETLSFCTITKKDCDLKHIKIAEYNQKIISFTEYSNKFLTDF